jgi:hypothetical protein
LISKNKYSQRKQKGRMQTPRDSTIFECGVVHRPSGSLAEFFRKAVLRTPPSTCAMVDKHGFLNFLDKLDMYFTNFTGFVKFIHKAPFIPNSKARHKISSF